MHLRTGRPSERVLALVASVLLVASVTLASTAGADPLDRVKGTEDWKQAGPESLEAEWKDWARFRGLWRGAQKEIVVQRRRSHRLAVILLRSSDAGPPFAEIRRALSDEQPEVEGAEERIEPTEDTGASEAGGDEEVGGATAPSAKPDPRKATRPPQKRPAPQSSERPVAPRPARGGADATPPPPEWTRVPVERLDSNGQAIDEEGDRELERQIKKNQKNPKKPR
jgi:hypothetical protein